MRVSVPPADPARKCSLCSCEEPYPLSLAGGGPPVNCSLPGGAWAFDCVFASDKPFEESEGERCFSCANTCARAAASASCSSFNRRVRAASSSGFGVKVGLCPEASPRRKQPKQVQRRAAARRCSRPYGDWDVGHGISAAGTGPRSLTKARYRPASRAAPSPVTVQEGNHVITASTQSGRYRAGPT